MKGPTIIINFKIKYGEFQISDLTFEENMPHSFFIVSTKNIDRRLGDALFSQILCSQKLFFWVKNQQRNLILDDHTPSRYASIEMR